MFKNITTVLILLLVVVVVWIGFSVYFSLSDINVTPNAETYIAPINPAFNTDGFEDMNQRTQTNLFVAPETFNALLESEN